MTHDDKNTIATTRLFEKAIKRIPPPIKEADKVKDKDVIYPGKGSLCFVHPETFKP